MEQELKPCPFCSGPAELIQTPMSEYIVRCENCWAQTGRGVGDPGHAIAAWNTRPQPASDSELVEAVDVEQLVRAILDQWEAEVSSGGEILYDNDRFHLAIEAAKERLPLIQSPDAAYEKAAQVAEQWMANCALAGDMDTYAEHQTGQRIAKAIRALKRGEG